MWPGLVRGYHLALKRWAAMRFDGWVTESMTIALPATEEITSLINSAAAAIVTQTQRPDAGEFFRTAMLNTWQTTLHPQPDGTIFVLTGDIPAMWLRDSSAQLRPFLALAPQSGQVQDVIAAVIARQWQYIEIDPYANAFNAAPNAASWHAADLCDNPWVWEQKYEIDSLAFPIQLAWQFWKLTGRTDHLAPVHAQADSILTLWRVEQNHDADSDYRFVRDERDTLGKDGRANRPSAITGMTWSGFRPSDDACELHYNIPAQLFAVHTLGLLAELATEVFGDPGLAQRATSLAGEITAGVEQYGSQDGVFSYEVDGFGGRLMMDDANMPSLISLPLCSDLRPGDPAYLATRAWVLSDDNPYFYRGSQASGLGSPHTPEGFVWHIGLAVQGLTSTDPAERAALINTLLDTTGGTGLMHEGFDPNDPTVFTRPWFSWANSMTCELLLGTTGLRLPGID